MKVSVHPNYNALRGIEGRIEILSECESRNYIFISRGFVFDVLDGANCLLKAVPAKNNFINRIFMICDVLFKNSQGVEIARYTDLGFRYSGKLLEPSSKVIGTSTSYSNSDFKVEVNRIKKTYLLETSDEFFLEGLSLLLYSICEIGAAD